MKLLKSTPRRKLKSSTFQTMIPDSDSAPGEVDVIYDFKLVSERGGQGRVA